MTAVWSRALVSSRLCLFPCLNVFKNIGGNTATNVRWIGEEGVHQKVCPAVFWAGDAQSIQMKCYTLVRQLTHNVHVKNHPNDCCFLAVDGVGSVRQVIPKDDFFCNW